MHPRRARRPQLRHGWAARNGKSQTIANIIVELVAAGRTVLFVSEKAAALDVVRNRLSDAALSPFLLELHSHAATRKQVVMELDKALNQSVIATPLR